MSGRLGRVCVTGGAGFIGSRLVRALLARGTDVTVIDNLSVGRAENVPAAARLVVGDILDADAVADAVSGCDAVAHLAARVAIRSSFEFAVDDMQTNATGTASVLAAAGAAGSVRTFVTTSSMAVYADADGPEPISEGHRTRPAAPYGVSKLAAERLTHMMCGHFGIDSVVLRLFNTFGPGQTLSPYVGVVTIFVNAIASGETPMVYGDGNQCRDFVHVDDVADALVAAVSSNISRETINVGTGVPTSVNAILSYLNAAMGTSVPGRHVAAVPGELRFSIADIGKARQLLGYSPQRRVDTSLDAVVREILASRELTH